MKKKQTKTPLLTKEQKELNQRLESERALAKKLRKAEVSARKEAIKNREPCQLPTT